MTEKCHICGTRIAEFQIQIRDLKRTKESPSEAAVYPMLLTLCVCSNCLPFGIQRKERVEVKTVTLNLPVGGKA